MGKKDVTDYRKSMQERADAELQAKLDMVRVESRPHYGRKHRKIGEMNCDTGVKTGYRNATASFVLRLDSTSGEFIAEHGDMWYISKSRDALQAKMDQVARVTFDLEWTRYLKVDYEAVVPYRDDWHSSSSETTFAVDDKRDKRPIYGVKLKWEVVEYSNPIKLPGNDDDRYMFREVDEDGNASNQQESKKELPAGLVIYTKERERVLEQIRAGFASIDKKMVELLGGSQDEVAKQLDSVKVTVLLEAPKKGGR